MDAPLNPDPAQSAALVATENAADAFPWPPADDENILFALAETWHKSVFQPTSFFHALPERGYLSALAYYLPLCVIAAALDLFWSSTFQVLGVAWPFEAWLSESAPANPALERLLSFLLSPVTSLGLLFIPALIVHGTLKLLGAARHPFVTTARVFAFTAGPGLFVAVPVLGHMVAFVWWVPLLIIGLREAQGSSTGRAIAAFAIPLLVLSVGALLLVV
ncbi:MAG: YIP1 family protein, partial [Longimicrobiales bacterium]